MSLLRKKPLSLLIGAALVGGSLTGCMVEEPPKRFATIPLGAEVTGLFVTESGDLLFNLQHPSTANSAPYNKGTIGAVALKGNRPIPTRFDELPLPMSDAEKQDVRLAAGDYRIVAQEGETFTGTLPFGLGAIVSADGTTSLKTSNDPDFNAFVPTNRKGDRGYLFTNWEDRPGAMSRLQIEKEHDGSWRVLDALNVDFSAVGGTWVNCFGTLSPWQTPLTSEELYFDDTSLWNSGDDSGVANLAAYLGYPADGSSAWPNPYRYGYIVEITNPSDTPAPNKLFAMGRYSHENAVVMPDNKTVYLSDDGYKVVFFKFVADVAGDLSAGTLYAARVTQDNGVVDSAEAGFDIEWIELAHGDSADIESWVSEYDDVTVSDYVEGASSYLSDADVAAWAAGEAADDRVAFLESRKAAAAKGATAEFNKMEGVNINYKMASKGKVPYMYMAMSSIDNGMSDTEGDIQLEQNKCGVVYQMALDSEWNAERMEPVVAGGPYDSAATPNRCPADKPANPDNLVVLEDGRVVIGEDSGYHENNMIWVWNPGK